MQILLANAKLMFEQSIEQPLSTPLFQDTANTFALEMASMGIEELALQLDCNRKLAAENWLRYQHFFEARKMPAIHAYNGQAYKHLNAHTLNQDALAFGQKHLWITCFLYGLLRPMDGIVPYRMEHCVKLQATQALPVNKYWKDKLTDLLIESVNNDDGILLHLSTEEYEHLFDWKKVKEEIRVIQPLFYVRKGTALKMQAVWAKTCRGAMVRYILSQQLRSPQSLYSFTYEGFTFNPSLGEAAYPHFIRE